MKTHFEPSTLYLDDSFSNLVGVGAPRVAPTLAPTMVTSTPIAYVAPSLSIPVGTGGMSSGVTTAGSGDAGTMMTGGLTVPTTTSTAPYVPPRTGLPSLDKAPEAGLPATILTGEPSYSGGGMGGGYLPAQPEEAQGENPNKTGRVGAKVEKKSFIVEHKVGLSLLVVALLGFGYYKYIYKK